MKTKKETNSAGTENRSPMPEKSGLDTLLQTMEPKVTLVDAAVSSPETDKAVELTVQLDAIRRSHSGPGKLIVITVGSQGGAGKTTTMVDLASWYEKAGIETSKIDLDEATKNFGSFHCFFPDVIRAPMTETLGLNALLQAIDRDPNVILVDSAASTTTDTLNWFDRVYGPLRKRGHRFLVIGVVTPDPASVGGFLTYVNRLQNRVRYLVVKNETIFRAPVAWDGNRKAQEFMEIFSPIVMKMPHRDGGLQQLLRQHGLTLAAVANGAHEFEDQIETMHAILAEGLYEEVMHTFDEMQIALYANPTVEISEEADIA